MCHVRAVQNVEQFVFKRCIVERRGQQLIQLHGGGIQIRLRLTYSEVADQVGPIIAFHGPVLMEARAEHLPQPGILSLAHATMIRQLPEKGRKSEPAFGTTTIAQQKTHRSFDLWVF